MQTVYLVSQAEFWAIVHATAASMQMSKSGKPIVSDQEEKDAIRTEDCVEAIRSMVLAKGEPRMLDAKCWKRRAKYKSFLPDSVMTNGIDKYYNTVVTCREFDCSLDASRFALVYSTDTKILHVELIQIRTVGMKEFAKTPDAYRKFPEMFEHVPVTKIDDDGTVVYERLDFENFNVDYADDCSMVISAGGDWQECVTFCAVLSRDGKKLYYLRQFNPKTKIPFYG